MKKIILNIMSLFKNNKTPEWVDLSSSNYDNLPHIEEIFHIYDIKKNNNFKKFEKLSLTYKIYKICPTHYNTTAFDMCLLCIKKLNSKCNEEDCAIIFNNEEECKDFWINWDYDECRSQQLNLLREEKIKRILN